MTPAAGFGTSYVPALDGLRALAILAVMASHTAVGGTAGGALGVHLFFVLSGFLITNLLLAERQSTGGVHLRHFWARRALRLLPALALAFAAIVAYALLTDDRTTVGAAPWVLLYVSNLRPGFSDASLGLFGPYWSLSVEEQFYVVWPLAFLAFGAAMRGRRAFLTVATIAGALALLRLGFGPTTGPEVFRTDRVADLLLWGCLLAMAGHWLPRERLARAAARLVLPAAVLMAAMVLVGAVELTSIPLRMYVGVGLPLYAIAGAVVLLHVLTHPGASYVRLLSHPTLVLIGRLSYALYLWHVLVFRVVNRTVPAPRPVEIAFGVGASFVVAWLSYRFVERPVLQRYRRRFSWGPVAPEARPSAR